MNARPIISHAAPQHAPVAVNRGNNECTVVLAHSSRCYKLPLANNSTVPGTLKKEMAGVCRACFAADSSKSARHMQVSISTPLPPGHSCHHTSSTTFANRFLVMAML